MITVTDNAAKAVFDTMKAENVDPGTHHLRVSVQAGGCSGLNYKLDFDDQTKEGDEVIAAGDVRIVVDFKSMLFLSGTTLDFTSGLNGQGFVFTNPNASGTCGCGQSFKV